MKKYTIIAIIVLALICAGVAFVYVKKNQEPERVACTLEAKVCPDGSYVGRTGPTCEFEQCPTSRFPNAYMEKAITDYLLTQNNFSWTTREGSHRVCSIENLDPTQKLFPLYVWAYCAEYVRDGEGVQLLSGTSLPAKINYPNELSFYDASKFTYEIPRDGTSNGADIEKIFPDSARKNISSLDKGMIAEENKAAALSEMISR